MAECKNEGIDWWHTPCYLCKQYCFHYLSICWCMNEKCENYNQTDSDLPHHVVTFADAV